MKAREYITEKYQSFGMTVSDADILDMLIGTDIKEDTELSSEEQINKVNYGFTKVIPQLLLHATSVSESGFSISWDIAGITKFYSMLCRQYDVEDVLSDKPKITLL